MAQDTSRKRSDSSSESGKQPKKRQRNGSDEKDTKLPPIHSLMGSNHDKDNNNQGVVDDDPKTTDKSVDEPPTSSDSNKPLQQLVQSLDSKPDLASDSPRNEHNIYPNSHVPQTHMQPVFSGGYPAPLPLQYPSLSPQHYMPNPSGYGSIPPGFYPMEMAPPATEDKESSNKDDPKNFRFVDMNRGNASIPGGLGGTPSTLTAPSKQADQQAYPYTPPSKHEMSYQERTTDENNAPTFKREGHKVARIQKWTEEEDSLIIYYKEQMHYSWKSIAQLIGKTHSWQAVQMRYLRTHKLRNANWSEKDEIRLINTIKKDWNNRWKRISSDLGPAFTPERCQDKASKLVKAIESSYVSKLFEQSTAADNIPHNKKLMMIYRGIDVISYTDSEDEDQDTPKNNPIKEIDNATNDEQPTTKADPVPINSTTLHHLKENSDANS
ncbi:hypothetical protein PP7435_CHR3-0675 [Komagataella phaffii CBS 7435]|uniref:Myb-like domain-containing protein n=2 Tax=Komagataella phaffii TaxID=460519 RepID=C4R4U3_KOMPG|nr:Hypothetical protein PAS_chr3_0530 [Komagataella phaffii GS115]AOA64118.1 GQ67_03603T0 [Komagataella phaffii]CAH2449659.1 hypothetical protein BQ9382_C3-3590 [Komagataella phaffii CBS 7435]AOA68682.1 GQ68_03574T0 [Komagataella phaffii GS115]CAY70579.1 Hypothetical protein PAS_chr3_0530 [Komagataella phaffii GS115]CCA39632.1 hypothetical protein PP7435_CHR3-0675 [Komagataella phaffii CBS 7435]